MNAGKVLQDELGRERDPIEQGRRRTNHQNASSDEEKRGAKEEAELHKKPNSHELLAIRQNPAADGEGPAPEDGEGVDEDQGFPRGRGGKVEPGAVELAQVEKRHDAGDVEGVERHGGVVT